MYIENRDTFMQKFDSDCYFQEIFYHTSLYRFAIFNYHQRQIICYENTHGKYVLSVFVCFSYLFIHFLLISCIFNCVCLFVRVCVCTCVVIAYYNSSDKYQAQKNQNQTHRRQFLLQILRTSSFKIM